MVGIGEWQRRGGMLVGWWKDGEQGGGMFKGRDVGVEEMTKLQRDEWKSNEGVMNSDGRSDEGDWGVTEEGEEIE